MLVGISYAYWQFSDTQKELNVAKTNCFSLTYTDNTDAITIDNMVPTKDEEGLKEKGYSFTIKNTCNTIATYEVNLEDILASSNVKQFPNQYIKISLNDSTPKVLNAYEEVKTTITNATNSFKLTSGSLKPDEEATYELKLWMDIETPAIDEVMSATFESKITVNTSYIEEENLANDITIIATSQNEDYSKEKEIFTIDIKSTNKNIIEYSFNKQNWTSVTPTKNLSLKQEYTKEGSYSIYVKDEVGNVKEYTINTDKLDQTAPERIIEETNNHETYLLKITMNDEKSGMDSYQITESKETPSEWLSYTGTIEKEISNNGIYYIWSKDKLGNISYEAYSINKIDKEAPTITLTDWGERDIIHIHLTDELIGLSGYQVTTTEEEPESFITIENTLETTIDYEVEENNTYYVYAKDAYNHVSHEKIVIDKIDGTAPIINTITNSSNGEWTNQNVTITIDAIDNETSIFKYQTKSSKTNNVWTDLTGNMDTFTTEINESVYYRVVDIAGNISEEKSTDIKIDKTAPSKPAIINSKENTWTGSDLPVTLTSTDSASGIDHYEWYENGAWTTRALTTTGNAGSITYTVTRNEIIHFRVIDKVGNISEESTTIVKIDKDKPTQSFSIVSSTSGSNGWYKALSIKATVSDSQSGVSSSKYCITTGSSCTPSTAATLSNNTFTVALGTNSSAQKVCVNTTDKVGNVSNTSCTGTYKVDTTNPTAKISASVSGSSITVNASGSSDSGSGIATYYYSKDGGSSFVTSSSSGYTFTGLSNATYTLVVKVNDKSGRVSSNVTTKATVNVGTIATTFVNNLSGKGQVVTDDPGGNARYIGSNPNNYVKFNNELWRIIGSFKNIGNGSGTNQTRLKIIRNSSYGSEVAYGSRGYWTSSSVKNVLNNTFYNSIISSSKSLISNAVWNIGTISGYVTPSQFYSSERSGSTWTGIVGLVYPSDYGYATSGGSTSRSSCLSKTLHDWSSASNCYNNDWLHTSDNFWTMNCQNASWVHAFGGNLYLQPPTDTRKIRPVVFLNTNVKIMSGSGTSSSPYILGT